MKPQPQKRLTRPVAAVVLCGLAQLASTASAQKQFDIRFDATVGATPFRCGQRYSDIGRSGATIMPQDFRVYVSNVALLDRDGASVPLELEQDGVWQHENVALLDFEDASGNCNGTAATNRVVRGTAPAGDYVGVRFVIGVPDTLNHRDATLAPSPLNYTGLFWNWRSGYIFLRLDLDSEPARALAPAAASGFSMHLGSVGCGRPGHGGSMTTPPDEPCSVPNRPAFEITDFDVDADVVTLNIAALLADADVTSNAEGTGSGCQSMPADLDCAPIFPTLGLPFGTAPAAAQSVIGKR